MKSEPQISRIKEALLHPAEVGQRIEQAVSRVIRGKSEVVRLVLTALFARGHLLIEDVPGVGKTTLARAVARALGERLHPYMHHSCAPAVSSTLIPRLRAATAADASSW